MAKKKVEKASPFVPVEEQPYQVPENWCWTYIGEIALIVNGYAFKSAKYVEKGVRIIRIANVQDGYIEDKKPVYYPIDEMNNYRSYLLYENDLLISLTGNVGRIAILPGFYLPAVLNQRVACLREKANIVLKQYLFYYFLRKEFVQDCVDNSKGSAQLNMSTEWLKFYPISIPPLSEQQRIVDRIENLFAKLDEAKEKVQAALDSFEIRKATVLHRAFSGELTEGWRKKRGIEKTWKSTHLANVVSGFKYGTSEKSSYANSGMPVLRIPNITDDGISFDDMKFLSHENVTNENQVHENDILIIRSNGSRELVGKSALVPMLNKLYAYGSFLIRITPMECVLPAFLVTFLNSSDARSQMFKKAKSSAGINNINSKELGAIKIDVPSLSEQTEIVRILDGFFAKEAQAKAQAEAALEAIDTMKKSILAKAFRGELGTNHPEDESAEELLKRTLA